MQFTTLPGTGISVSRLCLGTMTFGSPVAEPDAIRLVHDAAELGVNFIDTANMYEGYNRFAGSAGGVAEEIVGKAVAGRRTDFVVATKLGMKVGDTPVDENTSPEAIRVQLRRSLRRINTDYIDLYYLHRYDPNTAPGEIARAIGEELKAGTIRAWGVSNYSAEQLSALLAAAREENIPLPSMCQPPLSLLNTGALGGGWSRGARLASASRSVSVGCVSVGVGGGGRCCSHSPIFLFVHLFIGCCSSRSAWRSRGVSWRLALVRARLALASRRRLSLGRRVGWLRGVARVALVGVWLAFGWWRQRSALAWRVARLAWRGASRRRSVAS